MKPPMPDVRRPWLVNAQGKATRHRYVETAPVELGCGPAWEFVFECTITGVQRRWGAIERMTFPFADN